MNEGHEPVAIIGVTHDSEGRPIERPQHTLRERFLRTADQREYLMGVWDGVNRSGCQPLDDKVLVLMDEHAETTKGGIHITQQARERQNMASETGVVIALGEAAFRWNDEATRAWTGRKPKPGDRCFVERYAGQLLQGEDGKMYRLMSQKCLGGIAIPAEVVNLQSRRRVEEPA